MPRILPENNFRIMSLMEGREESMVVLFSYDRALNIHFPFP